MTYNESSKRASMKYQKKAYDTVLIRLPKERKDDRPTRNELETHAKNHNESVAGFILRAIQTQIAIDNGLYDKPLASILDSAQNDE